VIDVGSVGRRGRIGREWGDHRGQAVPLALVVIVLAVVLTMAMGSLGGLAVDASRARTAADAAALAGVEGGRPAAAKFAAEHGATLVAYRASGPADDRLVTVRVRVGRATATAAATNRGP
jgi:Putative Flp pilus-assembly TadE/G-like